MRLKLVFALENNKIDIQYRKSIISWIKHSLEDYDENLYKEIYDSNHKKTFTFATILPKPQFTKEEITLKDSQFSVVFSAYNYVYALYIYNAFLKQKYQKYSLHQNSMTLTNMILIPEKEIIENEITIKMSSPLITRNHDRETLKDIYYAFNKEGFETYLKINIEEQLQAENLDTKILEEFKIIPVQAKKIVIPVYEKMIECSIGIFKLQGDKTLLNYLYRAGIGAKKAMGFGLFEVI